MIPEINAAFVTQMLNQPIILPDSHYIYVFNTSENQIQRSDADNDTHLLIDIPYTWQPAYDQLLTWELSHYRGIHSRKAN